MLRRRLWPTGTHRYLKQRGSKSIMPNLRITLHSTRAATRSKKSKGAEKEPRRLLYLSVAAPNLPITPFSPSRMEKRSETYATGCARQKAAYLRALCHANWIYPLSDWDKSREFQWIFSSAVRIQFADIFKHAWAYWISSGSIVSAGHAELAQMMPAICSIAHSLHWKAFEKLDRFHITMCRSLFSN